MRFYFQYRYSSSIEIGISSVRASLRRCGSRVQYKTVRARANATSSSCMLIHARAYVFLSSRMHESRR